MLNSFGFLDLGTPELLIILAIVLLLFGGKKLPQLSRSLGESVHELRKGIGGDIENGHSNNTKTEEASSDTTKAAQ
jgi:sec-independent protein translocase protein TatA